MHQKITLNDIINSAFLADQSYENFANGRVVTNPATGSSFEVEKQKKSITGFSATVFRNINTNEYTIANRGTELTDPNDFRTNARVGF